MTRTPTRSSPFSDATGGTFVTSVTGESSANTWYRIHLTAIDSAGNTHHVTRDVVPLTATVTLATQPSGLTINLDGTPVTAPHKFTGVRNFQRELSAPQTQTVGGAGYRFVSWSDGGSMTHTISVPETATTITAVYEPVAGSNLFQNGGFENGGSGWLAPWRSNIRSPGQATLTREVANPASGSGALRVDITAASLDWYVQVLQPNISLTVGVQHTLSFAARATANRTIRLAFHRNSAPFPVYFQQSIPITSGWQVYTVTFTPPSDDPRSLFALNVGGAIGTLWLDDVSLTR